MTRIAQRTYRIRRRNRRIRIVLVLALAAAATAVVLWRRAVPEMTLTTRGTPAPTAETYDQSLVTREMLLEEEIWYAIQTGVFSGQEAAQEKADAYVRRGAPGTVVQDGLKWRVFIASYGAETDAAAVRQHLGEQRVETYLYPWVCPELHLRLTGMAGQLDVAEAGLTLWMQAARQLRDTAILLDASQMTAEDAASALRDLNSQISLWAETARERFGNRQPEVIARMLSLGERWTQRYAALAKAAGDAASLSAGMKGEAMALFADMITLRSDISAQ